MIRKLSLVLALLAPIFALPHHASAQTASALRTLVRAGHVLDVKTGKLSDAQTIVVTGDTIQSIQPTASVAAQPGDKIIDLGGMTVLPGLIDVHTHLDQRQGGDQWRGERAHYSAGRLHQRA
jgi:imidazolonepropionase-like amidohydrolase